MSMKRYDLAGLLDRPRWGLSYAGDEDARSELIRKKHDDDQGVAGESGSA